MHAYLQVLLTCVHAYIHAGRYCRQPSDVLRTILRLGAQQHVISVRKGLDPPPDRTLSPLPLRAGAGAGVGDGVFLIVWVFGQVVLITFPDIRG